MQTTFRMPEPSTPRPGTKPMTFIGGPTGAWKIDRIIPVVGEGLPAAERLSLQTGFATSTGYTWAFRGVAGHARYVERRERTLLDTASPPLGRPDARTGVFIPICTSPQWWALTQEERRAIFEERSHHIAQSLTYLPAVARRLYQSQAAPPVLLPMAACRSHPSTMKVACRRIAGQSVRINSSCGWNRQRHSPVYCAMFTMRPAPVAAAMSSARLL